MLFTKMSGRYVHSVLVGLVCLTIASAFSFSSVGSTHNITCLESERHALLEFQQGLVDESNALASWKSEKDCCKWRGISCNPQTGHVTHLNFSFCDPYSYPYTGDLLRGEISHSLLELGYLYYLDLSYIDFGGMMIPKFIGSLSRLKELRLARANFSGSLPPQLGNLSNLQTLDLSWNDFQGTMIPMFIGSLGRLKELRLARANFSGSLPPQLGNLSNLQTLVLSSNQLDVNSENLELLSHLSSLSHLDMSLVNLSKVVNWPRSVSKLTSLRELVLAGCGLPDVNLRSLSSINSSNSLQLLHLSDNYLNNSIFDWIANVSTDLVHLELSDNSLEGPIPDVITSMLSLATLDLSYNHLKGGIPNGFQNLCSLESLRLRGNDLSGNIEDSLKSLSCAENTLGTLDFAGNKFWGSFPDLKGFSKLRILYLSDNTLNGSLPESVGQLSFLESLDLSGNSMSGVITESHFLNLSRLRSLSLSGHRFSNNLRSDWNPPFQLDWLDMSSCKVGPSIPKWILTQTNLTHLLLKNAGLHGSLSLEFWDLFSELLWLDLSMNLIHGELPNLSKTRLVGVDLSDNRLSGAVPSFSLELRRLSLSNNMFSEFRSSFCATLNDPKLDYLDLSNNLLSGELPHCLMKFQQLEVLGLGRNNFYGKIPSWLGNLPALTFLHLHVNNFSGELPSLENCTGLQFIDLRDNNLSGKIPTWIGQSLTDLVVLSLRSNNFNGIIPVSLCNLAAIHVLDISHNNISGGLPHCFHNITRLAISDSGSLFDVELVWKGIAIEFGENLAGMRSIDMSSNHLIGEIPESIASMTELKSLNLSRNCLNGKLPENFGNMKMLESLDLSRNKMYGEIPASFSRLNFLGVLDVSHNQLSGRIPQGTQLQSFNASSYMGNLGLCGPPLTQICRGDETTTQAGGITKGSETDNKKHDSHISLGLVISTTLGFITGFWVVCGSLLLKSSWRYAYFKLCDNSKDWVYNKVVVYKAKMQRKFQSKGKIWKYWGK